MNWNRQQHFRIAPWQALWALLWTVCLFALIAPHNIRPRLHTETLQVSPITLLTPDVERLMPQLATTNHTRSLTTWHAQAETPHRQVSAALAQVPEITDNSPLESTAPLVLDPQALRAATQTRGVAKLAEDSGRPLVNSKSSSEDKWRHSIQSAGIADCLQANPQGMGLLNAPVLIYKAMTDKCK